MKNENFISAQTEVKNDSENIVNLERLDNANRNDGHIGI